MLGNGILGASPFKQAPSSSPTSTTPADHISAGIRADLGKLTPELRQGILDAAARK
jgi:hypothetical protein